MGLIVIDAGLSTTIQDEGRPGYREWGVQLGGAFDRGSAELANVLVGNPPGCAVLEFTLLGGTYEADCPLALALVGAPMDAKIVGREATEDLLPLPTSFTLQAGDRLALGRNVAGARTYLAVRGGWTTRPTLGSRSSERRLHAGDVLPAAPATIAARRLREPLWRSPIDEPLRIIDGPDCRDHPELDAAFWSARQFCVGARSSRMGLYLQGEPLAIVSPAERLSAPVAPGAVQVAGGRLIVLGVACGTMGGYPHLAHVISADLDRLGQLKPGDFIAFRRVTLDQARREDRFVRETRRAVLSRTAAMAADS